MSFAVSSPALLCFSSVEHDLFMHSFPSQSVSSMPPSPASSSSSPTSASGTPVTTSRTRTGRPRTGTPSRPWARPASASSADPSSLRAGSLPYSPLSFLRPRSACWYSYSKSDMLPFGVFDSVARACWRQMPVSDSSSQYYIWCHVGGLGILTMRTSFPASSYISNRSQVAASQVGRRTSRHRHLFIARELK